VPHLWAELGLSQTQVHLRIDFLPRADASFSREMAGSVQASLDDQYERQCRRWWAEAGERWYTAEVCEILDRARALPGAAIARARQPPEVCGPLLLEVDLPRTDENTERVLSVYGEAFERWLGWKRAAIDRAAQQSSRDPADTSGSVGSCRISGARSQAATLAAYAHDARVRAHVFSHAVDELERAKGRPVMSGNVAAARALHPSTAGASAMFSLCRMGWEGCSILAEAGPADPINRWTEELVYASTETTAPAPQPAKTRTETSAVREALPSVLKEPERGC